MIGVIADKHSPRLHFACEVLFQSVLLKEWKYVHEGEDYSDCTTVFCYTKNKPDAGVWIKPSGLLYEKGTRDVQVGTGEWEGLKTLFPTKGDIPFDLFSAIFYLSSRYEEYLPYRGDRYGRFPASESLAHKEGFLEEPIIDQWADEVFKNHLNAPDQAEDLRRFEYISTIDIDSAFAYRYKGLMRTLGGFAKDISAGKIDNMKDRLRAISGKEHDPFYTYDLLSEWHKKYNSEVIYFFLLADYGLNDKGVSYRSPHLQELIRHLGDYHKIGIHPGFQSNSDPALLEKEIQRLEQISRREVKRSRQHFLMLRFPDTYRKLIAQGISDDYTMGYASTYGFRAGTSRPFPFYDIEQESITKLKIHPFAVMDATLNMYLEYSPERAMHVISELSKKLQAVKGRFITLWHNESLSEKWGWDGWRPVYEHALASEMVED